MPTSFHDCRCECHFHVGFFHCFGPMCCEQPDVRKERPCSEDCKTCAWMMRQDALRPTCEHNDVRETDGAYYHWADCVDCGVRVWEYLTEDGMIEKGIAFGPPRPSPYCHPTVETVALVAKGWEEYSAEIAFADMP